MKDSLFRLALRITMNREESEDIVQDTLLKLWQKRDELSTVANLQSFALTMVRNLSIDRKSLHSHRTVTFETALHDREDESQLTPLAALSLEESRNKIATLVQSLPEKQRTVIQLRDIEGKTYHEIAEMLSITEADVKVSLFRARKTIKESIEKGE